MTAMRATFSALFIATLTLALAGGVARAQEDPVTHGLTTAEIITQDDVENISVNFNEAFETIDNPFLSDIFKLNYQVTLLQKMVDRQGQLERIAESLGSMGASFKQPPPPRGICTQLPPNAPCLKAYPELYPEIVKARHAYYDELKAKSSLNGSGDTGAKGETPAETKARLEREAKAEKERLEKLAKAERLKRYEWTEVSCLRGTCKGVLIATKTDGYRATVHRGTVLVDGTDWELVGDRIATSATGRLTVAYTHGLTTLPDELVELVCMVAARIDASPTTSAIAQGVQQQTSGPFSIGYGWDSYKAQSGLTEGEKQVLGSYWPKLPRTITLGSPAG